MQVFRLQRSKEKKSNGRASQIKNKKRVKDRGEVFTAKREVNAMLDMVKEESYRIDSRFLEPACGNGNFLVEILRRKLQTADKADDWEAASLKALDNIYGIDIMRDNVEESRKRMADIFKEGHIKKFGCEPSKELMTKAKRKIGARIICGDSLETMKRWIDA